MKLNITLCAIFTILNVVSKSEWKSRKLDLRLFHKILTLTIYGNVFKIVQQIYPAYKTIRLFSHPQEAS